MDCQSGCTVPRQHHAECADLETCHGCLPRPADDASAVCRSCRGRLHDALVRLPDLVQHIREHVVPGSPGGDSVHVRGTRTPPAPLSVPAVDDADALHSMLAAWCGEVMDGRDVRGPVWRGTMVLAAAKRTLEGRHRVGCSGRRCTGCAVAYAPPRVFGLAAAADGTPTSALVEWLHPHLDWALAQAWADEIVYEVTAQVRTVGSRWPVEERPTRCAAPCPACDRLTLTRYAPQWHTGPVSIRCTATDCGEPLDERLYGHYVRVLADTYGGAA